MTGQRFLRLFSAFGVLIFMLIVPGFIGGCIQAEEYDILEYQNGLSGAEIRIESGYDAVIEFYDDGGAEIIIESPEELCGIRFRLGGADGGICSVRAGEMEIPLNPELAAGLMPLADSFSLKAEWLCEIVSESDIAEAVFRSERGKFTLYLKQEDKKAVPVKIRAEAFGRDLTFEIKSLKYK